MQPDRLLDLVNALALLTPLGILGCVLAPFVIRRERLEECLAIASVAFPMALLLVFVRPQQGVFRDLDVLAPGAVAVGFVAAWAIGRTIERDRSGGGLAVAVATACFSCTIAWLALLHDPSRGMAWVRGFTTPEARRSPIERALTWDYLGFRAVEKLQWQQAADAWRATSDVIATARTLSQLAMAETMLGQLEDARSNFRRAVKLDPELTPCRGTRQPRFDSATTRGADRGERDPTPRFVRTGAARGLRRSTTSSRNTLPRRTHRSPRSPRRPRRMLPRLESHRLATPRVPPPSAAHPESLRTERA
jgi:hypothetical protein